MRLEAADWADRLHEVSASIGGRNPDWVPARERLEQLLSGRDVEEETSNVVEIAAFISLANRGMSD